MKPNSCGKRRNLKNIDKKKRKKKTNAIWLSHCKYFDRIFLSIFFISRFTLAPIILLQHLCHPFDFKVKTSVGKQKHFIFLEFMADVCVDFFRVISLLLFFFFFII